MTILGRLRVWFLTVRLRLIERRLNRLRRRKYRLAKRIETLEAEG